MKPHQIHHLYWYFDIFLQPESTDLPANTNTFSKNIEIELDVTYYAFYTEYLSNKTLYLHTHTHKNTIKNKNSTTYVWTQFEVDTFTLVSTAGMLNSSTCLRLKPFEYFKVRL